jgi:ribulose-phosphate 3-epimerase
MIKIAPSILSADFANLGRDIEALKEWNADWIHFDVDGRALCAENLSSVPVVCSANRPKTKLPNRCAPDGRGTNALCRMVHSRRSGRYYGSMPKRKDICTGPCSRFTKAAAKPGRRTESRQRPPSRRRKSLPFCDLVLVMSVNPGFGEQ